VAEVVIGASLVGVTEVEEGRSVESPVSVYDE
jgi:hypothetical protein